MQKRHYWVLIGTALFAALWVLARAYVQAITIDEADTYLFWAGKPWPSHWTGGSNNHVLNSVLIRLVTSIFGISHLTVRAPAIFGALIYIGASLLLCITLVQSTVLRWAVLVCLLYNPFVLDYLVAARGYSLALAFLMGSIAIPVWCYIRQPKIQFLRLIKACSLCSVASAFSFAANFSFAFIDGIIVVVVFTWACWECKGDVQPGRGTDLRKWGALAAACLLPGLIVAVFLCGSVLQDRKGIELVYGATSLSETLKSVVSASVYELNPFLVNPLVFGIIHRILHARLLAILGFLVAGEILLLLLHRKSLKKEKGRTWPLAVAGGLAGALVLTLMAHWLAFRLMHLLLPKDRTALYLVPLSTLLVGCVAAVPLPSRFGEFFRRLLVTALFCLGILFLMCMRLTYFKEWKYDANVNRVYEVIAYYNRSYGIRDVATEWRYCASLNFYRRMSGRETFNEFIPLTSYPAGKKMYVLYYPNDEGFITAHGLKVVYHGDMSDVVVAIDPELEKTAR
jgi:hypothetical protein